MKIPSELCMHRKAKLGGLVLPITARWVWSSLKLCWGWMWRCSQVANPPPVQRMLCQVGSGKVGRWGRIPGREEPHRFASLVKIKVQCYPTGLKGGAAPDKSHHQQLQWCLLKCDRKRNSSWCTFVPGNPGVPPAQSLHSTFWKEEHWGELHSQLLICRGSLVSVQAISHFASVAKYSGIYEATHWKCDLTCLINIITTVPPRLASVQWNTKRSCVLVSSFVDLWNPSFFHCIALLL